ncbi:MAG TPA: hypothetical protein VH008_26420 [Pseudonocardia sp.]|nr:hypothetical protein [Pseudonocardia sp.]
MDDDGELLLAGYLSVPRAVRADRLSPILLPEMLISISDCLTGVEHGPDPATPWHLDPAGARRFEGHLLAIGFSCGDATERLAELDGSAAPESADLLAASHPMPPEARVRGFEPIGVEGELWSFHSWLCHGYETEVATVLGILPNRWGLLDTCRQAHDVLDWMLTSAVGVEPVHWTAAAIAECD